MSPLTEDQRNRNWCLLWDIRRNVRYYAKRAGWFDAAHRFSAFLCFICGSGAFAAFAGHWQTAGYLFSGFVTLFAAFCAHYDYPKRAALCRTLRAAYLKVLEAAEADGGLEMTEADCRRLSAATRRVERTLEEPLPATLALLMATCENEVAERDMEHPTTPPIHIPTWTILIRQVWLWRWPACSQAEYAQKAAAKKARKETQKKPAK